MSKHFWISMGKWKNAWLSSQFPHIFIPQSWENAPVNGYILQICFVILNFIWMLKEVQEEVSAGRTPKTCQLSIP